MGFFFKRSEEDKERENLRHDEYENLEYDSISSSVSVFLANIKDMNNAFDDMQDKNKELHIKIHDKNKEIILLNKKIDKLNNILQNFLDLDSSSDVYKKTDIYKSLKNTAVKRAMDILEDKTK